jgi:hypothetical protein
VIGELLLMLRRHASATCVFWAAFSVLLVVPALAKPVVGAPEPTLLRTGTVGSFHWRVLVYRGKGSQGGRTPCIVALSSKLSGGVPGDSSLTVCGMLQGSQILFAKSSGSGRRERTVLAMAYDAKVASVRIWLRGHRSRLVQLSMLSDYKVKHAQVSPFRYGAFGIARSFCLIRIVSYDSQGDIVDPGHGMSCTRG